MPRTRNQKRPQALKEDPEKSADEVFSELLQEVEEPSLRLDRPLKRRRVGPSRRDVESTNDQNASSRNGELEDEIKVEEEHEDTSAKMQQTAYTESESSSSEEDVDWDQLVDPDAEQAEDKPKDTNQNRGNTMAVDFIKAKISSASKKRASRLPSTRAERFLRLNIHRVHLCTLLAHVFYRNHWCNSEKLQASLRGLLSKHTRSFLHPSSDLTQYDQTAQFVRGLEEASLAWRGAFRITTRGMRRAKWITEDENLEEGMKDAEIYRTQADFRRAGTHREGSRDVGAQLFCAMLRSVDVEARLVCSLQPLPLTSGAPPAISTPSKLTVDLSGSAAALPMSTTDEDTDTSMKSTTSAGPRRVRRFGKQSGSNETSPELGRPPSSAAKPKRIIDSPHPIFWVETFNTSRQKWVPVDPLVTQTVNKAPKFEPPASDHLNDMTYVVAFSDDGSCRDVTRRYAKAYNAKTRKARVELTEDGSRWYKNALKIFRTKPSDRDLIEDAELSKREADEPMPRNIVDFKDHPYYALERHLRRNEVIHPRREVGKVSTGKAASAVEPIYRRRDVLPIKSADKWYRLGREINEGEQPLKLAPKARRPRARSMSPYSDDGPDEPPMVGLYSSAQTTAYIPPPAIGGRIPKNAFGNLDVYVPSMIPPGAVHIRAFDAIAAARLLGIDYADAVTGFTFKGRKGTAATSGIIVAREYREAVEEVVGGMRFARGQAEQAKRVAECLRLWKRFLLGLRIRERVMTDADEDKEESKTDLREAIDEAEIKEEKSKAEGGFFLDIDQGPVAQPTTGNAGGDPDIEGLRVGADPRLDADPDLLPARVNYWEPTITSPWDLPGALGQTDSSRPTHAVQPLSSVPDARMFEKPSTREPGGFLPEPLPEDEGGGFVRHGELVPHHEPPIDPKGTAAQEPGDPLPDETNGGCFMPETDEPPRRVSSTLPTAATDTFDGTVEPELTGASATVLDGSPSTSPTVLRASSPDKSGVVQGEKAMGEDSEESTGGLLLEDPEDEDLEPEWLVDETGF